jgi:hypothetical protein
MTMKRLLLPAVVAAGLLAVSGGPARAHGGAGFGFGHGNDISVNVSWWANGGGAHGGPGGCCHHGCVIPGFSPYYPAPTMFGGMQAAGYAFDKTPLYYGPFPYCGGYDAVGFVPAHHPAHPSAAGTPAARPAAPAEPGKVIEKGPAPKEIEKAPPAKVIEGAPAPKG